MMKPASYHSFLLDHFFFLPLRTRPGDSSCIPATQDVDCNYPRGNPLVELDLEPGQYPLPSPAPPCPLASYKTSPHEPSGPNLFFDFIPRSLPRLVPTWRLRPRLQLPGARAQPGAQEGRRQQPARAPADAAAHSGGSCARTAAVQAPKTPAASAAGPPAARRPRPPRAGPGQVVQQGRLHARRTSCPARRSNSTGWLMAKDQAAREWPSRRVAKMQTPMGEKGRSRELVCEGKGEEGVCLGAP
jgi:hypothetical protein